MHQDNRAHVKSSSQSFDSVVACSGVVAAVQKEFPRSLLMGVGWSLGANILVRYLGEEKSKTPLSAAVSLCNPFDLVSPVLRYKKR